jgi:trehalose 6-phosphate synthase/phosphatase
MREPRLIVVSNRLPFTLRRGPKGIERRPSAGGLVAALEPVLSRVGGVWIGWPGIELRTGERLRRKGDAYRIKGVALNREEVRRYYYGFSNKSLWPVFHSFPTRTTFERQDWEAYEQINARFARSAAQELEGNDMVWIHDYHLLRTPRHLRKLAPKAKIGFFLHIPFPPFDIFRIIPHDQELLRGMLGADLVGFHVRGYMENFLDCVQRLPGTRVDRERGMVHHEQGTTSAAVFPLGIDFSYYERLDSRAPQTRRGNGCRLILGVDRLDYTKGIPQRILALERLLELHPEHREKIVFLQLAVPSREEVPAYRELKVTIDQLIGRVIGRFATADWVPVRYLYRALPPQRLAALYRDADVALVTPLRDGMNLVAKEYVACQVGEPGVLVLSRLAGAAETMVEALQVNPYDIDATAQALHTALVMSPAERRRRMEALRARERTFDVHAWAREFLSQLRRCTGR